MKSRVPQYILIIILILAVCTGCGEKKTETSQQTSLEAKKYNNGVVVIKDNNKPDITLPHDLDVKVKEIKFGPEELKFEPSKH